MTHTLKIEARGDLEVVMTRTFDAPRRLVFDAWTKPELIERWLGARGGWTFAVCEVDLRAGGDYRFVWRHDERGEMGMRGTYREVVAPSKLVFTETFDDPWYEGGAVNTLLLEEHDGRTTMTTTTRYDTREARDGVLASPMESGVAESYDRLEETLREIAR